MIITILQPDGPYKINLDTEVMEVVVTKAFIGPSFVTEDDEMLNVQMRDSGFELHYTADDKTGIVIEMKNGKVTVGEPKPI